MQAECDRREGKSWRGPTPHGCVKGRASQLRARARLARLPLSRGRLCSVP